MIKEVIVVEGRDDEAAVKRAVEAETIATHGFGIREATWELIARADKDRGIIIFTDPDYAGEQIRKRVAERFPSGKHAYLAREDAEHHGDIGIENARPESIRAALEKIHARTADIEMLFSQADLLENGLIGSPAASKRRDFLGQRLGIGYGNSKVFLNRLNQYGITREDFEGAIKEMDSMTEK